MLYDSNGRQIRVGHTIQDFIWNPGAEPALPAWLIAVGSSILTYTSPGSSIGQVNAQTQATSPASGDAAGIQTAFSIQTSQFAEISFSVTGVTVDAGSSATNHSLQMKMSSNEASNGALFQSDNTNGGASQTRVGPGALTASTYAICDGLNVSKRKNLGMVIRPKTREVFWTSGDPADGAGVIAYSRDIFVDSVAPFLMQIITKGAAQRSMSIAKVHLRLNCY